MSKKVFMLVTTGKQPLEEVLCILRQIPDEAVDILQIREKHRTARELLTWYEKIAEIFPPEKIVINDRVDIAKAVQAGGVQLAHHSLPPAMARKVLGENVRIGCSVHSVHEAVISQQEGADFLIFGHIFSTPSKAGLPARGIEALRNVIGSVSIPVIAIGGIVPENTKQVLGTGCAGIAVMSSVFFHANPGEQVQSFREILSSFKDEND